MSLTLNPNEARKADNISSVIRESGKYIGTITRAEKLLSRNNTQGLGLSFKTDDGASANYLDIYTVKENGDTLRGYNVVQAILCCTRTKNASEGVITFERWDRDEGGMIEVNETGYPALMGKRVGLILQKELGTHSVTGADTERMNIVAVFEAGSELTASEILDQKTKPEKIHKFVQMIERQPVRDTRKYHAKEPAQKASGDATSVDFDDDIPF